MRTSLKQLLQSIDPDIVLTPLERRINDALNGYTHVQSQITDWAAFKIELRRFLNVIESRALRLKVPYKVDAEFGWGRCVRLLMRAWGAAGDKAAFEMARTGNEGGLYEVLKTMARELGKMYAETEIAGKVNVFWSALTAPEKLSVADEYLATFGQLYPSEMTEGSAARLNANMPKVLIDHPQTIEQFRRIGRDSHEQPDG